MMARLEALIRRWTLVLPPRFLLYGPPGIGKSTYAARGPSPVFLLTEDGLGLLDVPSFPLVRSYKEMTEYLEFLLEDPHDYQSVVIDSASGLDALIVESILRDSGAKNLGAVGAYGAGYILQADRWAEVIRLLDRLRTERNMLVLIIAHAELSTAEDAQYGTYDRWAPRIPKRALASVIEWCDIVAFATRRMYLNSVDKGRRTVAAGVGPDGGERIMHVSGSPAIIAKNRYGLSGELPLAWDSLFEVFSTLANSQKEGCDHGTN